MKNMTGDFVASWSIGLVGFAVWTSFLAYLATKQLPPML